VDQEHLVGMVEQLVRKQRLQFFMTLLALTLLIVAADLVHGLDEPHFRRLLLVVGNCRQGVYRLNVAEPDVSSCFGGRKTAPGVLIKQPSQQVSP
jgi:hypothetical protein